MSTMNFAALVLAHDPVALAKVACHMDFTADAANDDNWSRELDNDPGYVEWMEEQAEIENMRHARW